MNLRYYVQNHIPQLKLNRIFINWTVLLGFLMAVGVVFHTMILWLAIFPSIILLPLAFVEFHQLPEDVIEVKP